MGEQQMTKGNSSVEEIGDTKISSDTNTMEKTSKISERSHRYPHCIVWTPIPLITWFFPFIGHMGIATSDGLIRDFAGSYYVSEDRMGFGWPTLYWQLPLANVTGGATAWDEGVSRAANEYQNHVHSLFLDNCHSMVALALNEMLYRGRQDWTMARVCFLMLANGRFVGLSGFMRQYAPSLVMLSMGILIAVKAYFVF